MLSIFTVNSDETILKVLQYNKEGSVLVKQLASYVKAFELYLHSLNKSPHTVKQYTIDAKQFAEIVQHEATIEEALQLYSDTIKESYKAVNSVNRKFASTRNFLQFLQLRGEVGLYNPKVLLPLPKQQQQIPLLRKSQAKAAMNFWIHQYEIAQSEEHQWLALRNTAIILVIAELGIKPAELVKMEWKHWNLDTNELVIRSKKKFRMLHISSKLAQILERYKVETHHFLPNCEHAPFMWLGIGNKQGEPITVKTIERIFLTMSQKLHYKVTATNLRYYVIQQKSQQTDEIDKLVEQFGYARKGVLTERQQRFIEY